MKSYAILACVLVVGFRTVPASMSEEVYLKSEASGRVYGPFDMREGERIQIGKSAFWVVPPPVSAPARPATLEDQLRSIRLPEVEFRNARPEDCIAFIETQLRSLAPELTVRMHVKRAKAFRVIDTTRTDPFADPARPSEAAERRVTLAELNGTVHNLLSAIADQAGFQLRYSGRTVTLIQ